MNSPTEPLVTKCGTTGAAAVWHDWSQIWHDSELLIVWGHEWCSSEVEVEEEEDRAKRKAR